MNQCRQAATIWIACLLAATRAGICQGELPNPVLNAVFPPGGQAGTSVRVTVAGENLAEVRALHCRLPGLRWQQLEAENQFEVTIPPDAPPGLYDLRVVGAHGISSPRPFVIGNRAELIESESHPTPASAQQVPLNVTINGRIAEGGELDHFSFEARQGQRVVVECRAERIDSRLRAVLELFDQQGRQLASSRGYYGSDPLIDFRVPADGVYIVKLYDLIYSGSHDHYYRLDVDTGPRVAFTVPAVIQRDRPTRVALYGWNLRSPQRLAGGPAAVEPNGARPPAAGATRDDASPAAELDRVEVEIPAALARPAWPLPARLSPAQAVSEALAYHFPGSHAPVLIGVTDVPVAADRADNHSAASAQPISYPCEVSGRLVGGDEQDWFAIQARRGEVLHFEGLGERIGSPIDLDVRILDEQAEREWIQFGDEVTNVGGSSFPTSHLDPAGRWVVPADGRYLLLVRNLMGGSHADPRRRYRLGIRREEPDFSLAVVSRRSDPAALNVARGGRTLWDVLAFRRRGLDGPIRVSAAQLPTGMQCPDVYLGPGVDRAVLVVSADQDAPPSVVELSLTGSAELAGERVVRAGTVVRGGLPSGWGRLTADLPLAVAGDAPLRITARGDEPRDHHLYGHLRVRHSPGGVLDVAVQVQRREAGHQAPVKLLGVGLPPQIMNQTATIPAGADKGYISFYLPPTLPVGSYSLAVRAETTVPQADNKTKTVTVYSNAVSFAVHPPAFHVEVDPYAPRRIRRGEVVQVNYTARRQNGFIGKIHTELAVPGIVTEVPGLRGRGVTFVGQTESGTIQVIANKDAPLGQQPFLRLYGVGVVEDQPTFHGSCFLNLEVVE